MSSTTRSAPTAPPPSGASADAWKKGWPWLVGIAVLLVGLSLLAFLLGRDDQPEKQPLDFFALAAPFIAIAAALERFWEALFNWYERFALQAASLAGVTARGTAWMRNEAANAEKAVATLVELLGQAEPGSPGATELWEKLRVAEKRLLEANDRINEIVRTPEYRALKRSITVAGSLVAGLAISVVAKLTLLGAIGFNVPVPVDMIVTGLLIGSGPGPMHAFIGTLTEFRNTLGGLAESARGGAIRQAAEGLNRAIGESTTQSSTPPQQSAPRSTQGGAAMDSAPGGTEGTFREAGLGSTTTDPEAASIRRDAETLSRLRSTQRALRR